MQSMFFVGECDLKTTMSKTASARAFAVWIHDLQNDEDLIKLASMRCGIGLSRNFSAIATALINEAVASGTNSNSSVFGDENIVTTIPIL